jgi:UDP-3-O-[3-hydroxymyristoyl] glucosamine N-acyltransferase
MQPVRLSELAAALGMEWEGEIDPLITGVSGIADAGPGDITFVSQKGFAHFLEQTRAAAVILPPGSPSRIPVLRAEDPYGAFARLLARLEPCPERIFAPGIHPTAVVDPSAHLGEQLSLGPYVVIGAGARIGDRCALGAHVVVGPDTALGEDCRIYPQVTIREGCILGRRVILHAGAVIGSDGFGYLPGSAGLSKIPQIGRVVLEDDVEIGANCCVDRATSGETVVGVGTKIDNLVQIGHNVTLGQHCAISAQTGISGSCRIGNRVTMGGQVGVADHIAVGDEVKLGAKSGIHKDVPPGMKMFGYPAFERTVAFRMVANLRRIPEFLQRLRRVEQALGTADEQRED